MSKNVNNSNDAKTQKGSKTTINEQKHASKTKGGSGGTSGGSTVGGGGRKR